MHTLLALEPQMWAVRNLQGFLFWPTYLIKLVAL